MRHYLIGLALAMGPTLPARAASPLTDDDLFNATRTVATYERKDRFEPGPAGADLAGKAFRVSLPLLSKDDGTGGSAYWTYDPNTQTLGIHAGMYRDAVFYSVTRKVGETPAQNAFGAKVKVKSYIRLRYVLTGDDLTGFDVSLQVPPAKARALASEMRLVMEGSIVAPNGRAITCEDGYESPTFDDPTQVTTRRCAVSAVFSRVAVVDANGSELARMRGRRPTRVVTNPNWVSRPSAEQLAAEAPAGSGRAMLECVIGGSGELSDCEVTSAVPAAVAEPALRATRFYRSSARTVDGGATTGALVVVPIRF
jgi:hypothetical protein